MDADKLKEIRSALEQELDVLEILAVQPQSPRLLAARLMRIEAIKIELHRLSDTC